MKIETTHAAVELNAYLKQIQQQRGSAVQPEQPFGGQADKVHLSDRAREIQQATQASRSMPDVREDKVAQVKSAVDQNTYTVDGAKAAAGMMRESLENDLILQSIDIRA